MKSILKPGRIACAVLCVLFLVLAVIAWQTDMVVSDESDMLIPVHKKGIGALTAGTAASQTFVPQRNGLTGIEVMANKFSKKPKAGSLFLTVTDADGSTLGSADIAVTDFKDNAWVTVSFDKPLADSAGKQLTVSATSDCTDQKGVTLRMGPGEALPDGTVLTLADGTQDSEGNALNLRMNYTVTTRSWMSAATLLLIALCFLACIPLSATRKEDRHA